MKKLTLTSLLILITLGFSSCSAEDDSALLQETSSENLLKSFNLNKDSNGQFALNYELGEGASSDNVLDSETNTNNIYLYSSDNQRQVASKSQGLAIQNGQLSVNFNDTENDKNHRITILDDDIQMKSGGNELLESYEISGNGDGTYDLDFKVADGVAVDFIYNDDTRTYEIHLNSSLDATQSEFVQTFTKQEGVAINIDFYDKTSGLQKTDGNGPDGVPDPQVIIEEGGPDLD